MLDKKIKHLDVHSMKTDSVKTSKPKNNKKNNVISQMCKSEVFTRLNFEAKIKISLQNINVNTSI